MNATTSPQVLPMSGSAWLTMPDHCCAEVSSGTSLAARAFQSNGCVGSFRVATVKLLATPAPTVIGSQETVMLPWKPGGSVPYGPAELAPISCSFELV